MKRWIAAFGTALFLFQSAPAFAVQHLVRTSDDWQSIGPRLRPGDEIILMPGEHQGASFEKIIGTLEQPITIRGADPENPSTIVADREGIRINNASNVIIKDLIITGAKINGIQIAGGETATITETEPALGNIVIRNVKVLRTGPRGQRHAVLARYLRNVRIEACHFEGWAGSAIELVGCDDVAIARCSFLGITDYSQNAGVRIRAGSQAVEIEECRFENAGAAAIRMGDESKLDEYLPARLANASDASLFEASRIGVQRSLIIGSECAIVACNVDGWTVRNNTIFRPRRCIFSMQADQPDPRFHAGRNGVIGRNLIVWEPGDLTTLFEISPKVDTERLSLDANVWWSAETPEQREKLGLLPGKYILPQILDVDPALNEQLKPTTPAVEEFGF